MLLPPPALSAPVLQTEAAVVGLQQTVLIELLL